MPDRDPRETPTKPVPPAAASPRPTSGADEAFLCDRCGTAMFRMHAVWRCPSCGYKTDCCGW